MAAVIDLIFAEYRATLPVRTWVRNFEHSVGGVFRDTMQQYGWVMVPAPFEWGDWATANKVAHILDDHFGRERWVLIGPNYYFDTNADAIQFKFLTADVCL